MLTGTPGNHEHACHNEHAPPAHSNKLTLIGNQPLQRRHRLPKEPQQLRWPALAAAAQQAHHALAGVWVRQ
jgi:hypothetical protein